jgi:hypothetical protein
MRARGALIVTLLAFAAATSALPQTQDQIPKELALALMPFGMADGGEIIVGQMPPDFSAVLTLPASARVLGSFVSMAFAQTVVTLPLRTDSALATVRRSLTEHGWTTRSAMPPTTGGLQFGPAGGIYQNTFCKTGDPSALTISAQFYGPSTSLVHLTRNINSGTCDQMMRAEVRQQMTQDFPLATVPPLWTPGDYRISSLRCRRQNTMNDQSQNQPLMTDLSPTEVLAYFGRQLDSAGWKSSSNEAERVSKTWSKAIGTRGTQEVTITVTKTASQNGCFDVSLRATGLPR